MKKSKRIIKKKERNKSHGIFVKILLGIFLLIAALFIIRLLTPSHLDDVHPDIQCDDELLQKTDIFYVIPKFSGVNISDDTLWCARILSYNKTLAIHGVYHTYKEFGTDRDESYIQEGAEEFKKCFGFYPNRFKAPQTKLSAGNKDLLKAKGYRIDTLFADLFHKVYHCDDGGYYPNWISDLV